ncbi:ATP-dependent helicase HrpB [Paenibacillus sp. WLX2291]|uniref:ATP-dependent helicase HrpB n=1 Tax=Paenibacillus sp. WLX2291 TaxID=3296934 RepID=UPI00398447AF
MADIHSLPIDALIPELVHHLNTSGTAVLIAEPGAGKTTRIPLALLHEPWLDGRRIIMLEPRRLAAISAARYMASALGESVGQMVGYRVALDTRVSERTRIEVVTEGVLTRMVQQDPSLEQAGIIIFDEFHERNLHADLGLALTMESRSLLRDDLRVLIMSATMNPEPVARLLDDAPVLISTGRSFPVDTIYESGESAFNLYNRPGAYMEQMVAAVIGKALSQHDGDMLVFLPGVREIRRTQQELLRLGHEQLAQTDIVMLHGGLKAEQQDQAVRQRQAGRRKVILSTSLAESSVTVDGVRIVIDSGLMRTRVLSPATGMEKMETRRVSVDAADQRRGRAGRQAAGVCYRLWSAEEHRILPAERVPEMLQSDLTPLALEVSAWGTHVEEMAWLTPPPAHLYQQGQHLLQQLEALDEQLRITEHGRRMITLGSHPRLTHMILRTGEVEPTYVELACQMAALLQERDILPPSAGIDLVDRVRALRGAGNHTVDQYVLERIEEWSTRFLRQYRQLAVEYKQGTSNTTLANTSHASRANTSHTSLANEPISKHQHVNRAFHPNTASHNNQPDDKQTDHQQNELWVGALLSLAYPDRIGQNRGDGRFRLRIGRGAQIGNRSQVASYLQTAAYIVAAELDDHGSDSRILLAAVVGEDQLRRLHEHHMEEVSQVHYDAERESIRAQRITRLGAIVLREMNDPHPSVEAVQQALLKALRTHGRGLNLLQWTHSAIQLRQRLALMHVVQPDQYPAMDDESLLAEADEWLLPYMDTVRKLSDLRRLQAGELLLNRLSWQQRQDMDILAPTHIQVPSGSRIPIDYSDPEHPFIAVRLQEMFGCTSTPLLGNRIPVTIQLLSPASRPVQVTSDLESFWQHAYFDIKKDLKGRYPKHHWPDDPFAAQPTNRVKPRN